MKKLLALTAMLVAAQAHAQEWKKSRSVSGFSGIQVSHGIDIYLKQGNTESLTFEVKGLEEKEVISEVKDGTLILRIDRDGVGWKRNNSVKAYLTFKSFNKLRAGGGSDVFSEGTLNFKDLVLDLGGGSDAKLALTADRLTASATGGSDLILSGKVARFDAKCSGGSDLKASDLEADRVAVDASGGSDAYIHANEEAIIEASGGSDVYYSGKARNVQVHKSGGSDVHKRN